MLSGWAILSDLPCIHQLEALCTLSFWVFVETSFHGHEPLNHWSVAINSTSSSSLYLEAGGRTETGAANALTTWLCSVASVMSDSLWSQWTVAHQVPLSKGFSKKKNTGEGCHTLLQGIFLSQGSNPYPLHCRWILYPLSHLENLVRGFVKVTLLKEQKTPLCLLTLKKFQRF